MLWLTNSAFEDSMQPKNACNLCQTIAAKAYIICIFFASVLHKAVLLMHVGDSVLGQVYIDCSYSAVKHQHSCKTMVITQLAALTNRASLNKQLPHQLL